MTELEFSFEPSAWELTMSQLKQGSTISAVRFLTLMEDVEDAEIEFALIDLQEKQVTLSVTDLPRLPGEGESANRLTLEEKIALQEDMRRGLEENDPLRLYLDELAGIPAAGDPQVLAERLAAGEDDVIAALVDLFLSRVVQLSREYTGRGVLLLDLIQEGSLGLFQGLQAYTGGDIYTHCDWWIRQSMAAAVTLQARVCGLGQKLRRGVEDFRDADEQLLTELGRNPTLEELANYLHITPEEAAALEETLQAARMLNRAKAPKTDTPQEEESAVEDTAYFQMRQRISELLSNLEPEDAKLLTLRYGLEGGLPKSAEQVALELGITAEQVTAREAAALMKLRDEK